jgi:ABC-type dipeptide/oligopeptide/nickel transport system permease component
MGRYLLRRLLATLPVLDLTSIVICGITRRLPGDPGRVIAGQTQAVPGHLQVTGRWEPSHHSFFADRS